MGQVAAEAVRPACGVRLAPDMEDVTRAKLQIRLVVVTFRQHLNRMPTDAAEAFRARALPILESVDVLYGDAPDVAQLLAEARGELDGAGH